MADPRRVIAPALFAAAMLSPGATAAQGGAAPSAVCNDKGLLPAQIRCFLEAAEVAGDVGVCEGAEEKSVRFNCISLFAERKGDPAVCQRIAAVDKEGKALRAGCIGGVAVAQRRPGLCEETGLDAMRDACYAQLVLECGAEPALCQRIDNAALKKACTVGSPPSK